MFLPAVQLQTDGGLTGSSPHQVLQSLKPTKCLDISAYVNNSISLSALYQYQVMLNFIKSGIKVILVLALEVGLS